MPDTYTGEVAQGGPPDTRDTGPLTITKLSVGPMDNNAYFLRCASTGDVLLIDAANEPDRLLAALGDERLDRIVTTHQHFDHWQALPEIVAATGAPVFAASGGRRRAAGRRSTGPLEDGDEVRLGDCSLSVIHLVGHTPGSIALLYQGPDRPHLFTGDSLFPGGVGRTTSPEDFTSLINDVSKKVFEALPDETWVYPGHGKDTTLGVERPHLDEWRERGW